MLPKEKINNPLGIENLCGRSKSFLERERERSVALNLHGSPCLSGCVSPQVR